VNLLGAVTWGFEFEDQPYFDGFRDLATNGIDKHPPSPLSRCSDKCKAIALRAKVPVEMLPDNGGSLPKIASRQLRSACVDKSSDAKNLSVVWSKGYGVFWVARGPKFVEVERELRFFPLRRAIEVRQIGSHHHPNHSVVRDLVARERSSIPSIPKHNDSNQMRKA
jgi:hypothetical protein